MNNVYFSIGEGISALAILFIFREFIGEKEKFRLGLRRTFIEIINALFFIAAFCTVIAAILSNVAFFQENEQSIDVIYYLITLFSIGYIFLFTFWVYLEIRKKHTVRDSSVISIMFFLVIFLLSGFLFFQSNFFEIKAILLYPLFWEFLSAIIFIFSIGWFYYCISVPIKFSKKNYKGYHQNCVDWIMKNKKDKYGTLITEIKISLNPIFKAAHSEKDKEYKEYGKQMLIFLSNKEICKAIVENDWAVLQMILDNYSKKVGFRLYVELTTQLIAHKDSVLTRINEEYDGRVEIGNIRKSFENYDFITSGFSPLHSLGRISLEQEIQPWQVKNYFYLINITIQSWIVNEIEDITPFNRLPRDIGPIVQRMAGKLNNISESEFYSSLAYQVLNEVHKGFRPLLNFLNQNLDLAIKSPLYDLLVEGVYQYFEGLSCCNSHDEDIRFIANLFYCEISLEKQIWESFEKKLLAFFIERVEMNMRGYFPLISRLIINLFSLTEPIEHNTQAYGHFKNEFLAILKKDYKSLRNSKKEFAEKMLPDNVRYDDKDNKLAQQSGGQEVTLFLD